MGSRRQGLAGAVRSWPRCTRAYGGRERGLWVRRVACFLSPPSSLLLSPSPLARGRKMPAHRPQPWGAPCLLGAPGRVGVACLCFKTLLLARVVGCRVAKPVPCGPARCRPASPPPPPRTLGGPGGHSRPGVCAALGGAAGLSGPPTRRGSGSAGVFGAWCPLWRFFCLAGIRVGRWDTGSPAAPTPLRNAAAPPPWGGAAVRARNSRSSGLNAAVSGVFASAKHMP